MFWALQMEGYPNELAPFRTWFHEVADGGRIPTAIYATDRDRVLFEIPHQRHRDLLIYSSDLVIEMFFRHSSRCWDDDPIQLCIEQKTWFFKPLLKAFASLPFSYRKLKDFEVTYINPKGFLRTAYLVGFAEEADMLV